MNSVGFDVVVSLIYKSDEINTQIRSRVLAQIFEKRPVK